MTREWEEAAELIRSSLGAPRRPTTNYPADSVRASLGAPTERSRAKPGKTEEQER